MTNTNSTSLTESLSAEATSYAGATMYVVDDDEDVRKSLSRLLRAHDFNVQTFSSAKEFLEHCNFSGQSCALLDFHMPEINGIELQSEISRLGITLPVIFLTGKGDIPTSVLAMKQGAIDFLVKPVDEENLLEAIDKALKKQVTEIFKKTSLDAVTACLNQLTLREREVLNLVIQGLLNKQIAFELGIAEKTVKAHRGKVMEKMQAKTIADLVHKCDVIGVDQLKLEHN
jgi:FixJ family two-component response regulator